MSGWSRFHRVSPEKLVLASHGQARLRVSGKAYGFIRVARERRWVWGDFDETFVVALPECSGAVVVKLSGLGGRLQRRVPYGPKIDLRSPPVQTQIPAVRAQVAVPRSRSLAVRRFVVPRLEPLRRSPIQSGTSETESTS